MKKPNLMFLSLILIVLMPLPVYSSTASYIFDTNEKLNDGTFFNIESKDNALVLTSSTTTQDYLWIANSGEGSLSKVDTKLNKEIARYWTGSHPGKTFAEGGEYPSRTAVDKKGNVWVGNRIGDMTVVKIAADLSSCIDKNNNGQIDTSYDANNDGKISVNEMLPWGSDECVLRTVKYWTVSNDVGPRALAIDLDGNLWVGIWALAKYIKIDSRTFGKLAEVDIPKNPGGGANRPYGAAIDKHGFLWSVNREGSTISKIDTKTNKFIKNYPTGGDGLYGIAIDKYDRIWVADYNGRRLIEVDGSNPDNKIHHNLGGDYGPRGVTIDGSDNVWFANSGSGYIYKYSPQGTGFGSSITKSCNAQIGNTPIGIVTDSEKNIWAVSYGGYATKINPESCQKIATVNVGNSPYTYSDATGSLLYQFIHEGTWTITLQNDKGNNIKNTWTKISWDESNNQGGDKIVVQKKSLERGIFSAVSNGGSFSLNSAGLTLEISIHRNPDKSSPAVSNIRVEVSCIGTDTSETSATDGIDNDCDGLIDETDPPCPEGTALCADYTCKETCIIYPPCDGDSICDSTESCDCSACSKKQGGCSSGLVCSATENVCVDLCNDNICDHDDDCGCPDYGDCKSSPNICTGTRCNNDAECPSDKYCSDGSTIQIDWFCSTDKRCGFSNNSQDCPQKECDAAQDCARNEKCSDGKTLNYTWSCSAHKCVVTATACPVVCPVGETMCEDGTCAKECNQQKCNLDGDCDKGEGCGCNDCSREQDSCKAGLWCSDESGLCSSPCNDLICDVDYDCSCENMGDCKNSPSLCSQKPECEDGGVCGQDEYCPDGITLKKQWVCSKNGKCGFTDLSQFCHTGCTKNEDCERNDECEFSPGIPKYNWLCNLSTHQCQYSENNCLSDPCNDNQCSDYDCANCNNYGDCKTTPNICIKMPECEYDFDCSPDEYCTNSNKIKKDWFCNIDNKCSYNDYSAFCPVIECSKTEDCATPEKCDNGQPKYKWWCNAEYHCQYELNLCPCPEGTTRCQDGQCKAECEIVNCNNNALCESGEGCTCPDCSSQQDSCASGLICSGTQKTCVDICNDDACEISNDCKCPGYGDCKTTPTLCITKPTCSKDSDCSLDEYCSDGITIKKNWYCGNDHFCGYEDNSTDCPAGPPCQKGTTLCKDGFCRKECAELPDCGDKTACSNSDGCSCQECFGQKASCDNNLRCSKETKVCVGICEDSVCTTEDCNCQNRFLVCPLDFCSAPGTCVKDADCTKDDKCDDGITSIFKGACDKIKSECTFIPNECPTRGNCTEGKTVCSDSFCRESCSLSVCNKNGSCDSNEGCGCEDCISIRGNCDNNLVCVLNGKCENPNKNISACEAIKSGTQADCGANNEVGCWDDNAPLGNKCCGDETENWVDSHNNFCCLGVFYLNTSNADENSCICTFLGNRSMTQVNKCDTHNESYCWDIKSGRCCGNQQDETWQYYSNKEISEVLVNESCAKGKWYIRAQAPYTGYNLWVE